jgi:hypothetical protein
LPLLRFPDVPILRVLPSGLADPDQHLPLFVYRHPLGFDQFSLEVLQILVIQREAALQGPIGHPAALP